VNVARRWASPGTDEMQFPARAETFGATIRSEFESGVAPGDACKEVHQTSDCSCSDLTSSQIAAGV
jgi:hypothetical protein